MSVPNKPDQQDSGTTQTEKKEEKPKEKPIVVGIILRAISDAIDFFLLSLLGLGIVYLQFLYLNKVPFHLEWVGLFICAVYFAIMHSAIGKGQSIGKNLFGIQVVDINGKYLNVWKSFVRFLIIAIIVNPGLFNFLNLQDASAHVLWIVPVTIYTFLLVLTISSVLVHPLKRGVHDYVAGSIVVNKGAFSQEVINRLKSEAENKKTFKKIIIFSAIVAAVVLGVFLFGIIKYLNDPQLRKLAEYGKKIEKEYQIKDVEVVLHVDYSQEQKMTYFIIEAYLGYDKSYRQSEKMTRVSRAIADLLVNEYPGIDEIVEIHVWVMSGVDLGVASAFDLVQYRYNNQGSLFEFGVTKKWNALVGLKITEDSVGIRSEIPIDDEKMVVDWIHNAIQNENKEEESTEED